VNHPKSDNFGKKITKIVKNKIMGKGYA
jgi:hypothetical protein